MTLAVRAEKGDLFGAVLGIAHSAIQTGGPQRVQQLGELAGSERAEGLPGVREKTYPPAGVNAAAHARRVGEGKPA